MAISKISVYVFEYIEDILKRQGNDWFSEFRNYFELNSLYFNQITSPYYLIHRQFIDYLDNVIGNQVSNDIKLKIFAEDEFIRVYSNHILRSISTFWEINDKGKYFFDYNFYADNAVYNDLTGLFNHDGFRGKTINYSVKLFKNIRKYYLGKGNTSIVADIDLKLANLEYSRGNIKDFRRQLDLYFTNASVCIQFVRIRSFLQQLSYEYKNYVLINQDKVDELEKFISKLNDLEDIDLYTSYCIYLLNIDFFYYRDKSKLPILFNQYERFLNEYVFDANKIFYEIGIINILTHKFLIQPDRDLVDAVLKFYNNCLDFPSNKVNLLIFIYSMSIFFRDFNLISFCLEEIERYRDKNSYVLIKPLWSLFDATYHHLTGNYKQSYLCLNDAAPLLNDKEGFGLGIRILEILNLIRTEKFDQVENALLNMKNQLTFLKKGGKIKPRFIYIYKILVKLHNTGYNYKKTFQAHKEKFRLMSTPNFLYAWEFRSPELLRFDSWYFEQAGFFPDWELNDPRMDAMNPLLKKA